MYKVAGSNMNYEKYKRNPKLLFYVDELLKWNKKINLISRNSEESVWLDHIRDSMILVPFVEEYHNLQIIDIGSGGGLPSIPLAISLIDRKFILTEVIDKKLSFLEWVCGTLNSQYDVKNLEVVNPLNGWKCEDDALIISRAYGSISGILEWRDKYAPQSKRFLLMKGTESHTLQEMEIAGIDDFSITGTERGTIIEFEH